MARQLVDAGYSGNALVFYSSDMAAGAVMEHLEELTSLFPSRCDIVPVTAYHPGKMIEYVRKTRWPSSLLIDVTCFNRENLFTFLWSLHSA